MRVYVYKCRISREARAVVEDEIARGREYYNRMIAGVNAQLEVKSKRIERLVAAHVSDTKKASMLAAKAIFRLTKRLSLNERAKPTNSAKASGCYTGTYHAVQQAFDQALSSKRVGVWPGEPYRYRRASSNSGAMVGVHIQPKTTWGAILEGRHAICRKVGSEGRCTLLELKVAKASDPILVKVLPSKKCRGVRREIPIDTEVSHVMIRRLGDYATGGKYKLYVTVGAEPSLPVAPEVRASERIGVDVGWQLLDGAIRVAVTSDGQVCEIPAYAVRMALREAEIQSERDELANECKKRHPESERRSASGMADWCKRHCDVSEADYLAKEHELHCRQDHVRRRFLSIRTDVFQKFASEVGRRAIIIKPNLRGLAEEELKGQKENYERKLSGNYQLLQLLKNRQAVEVRVDREGVWPSLENAKRILEGYHLGNLQEVKVRRAVRKYRRKVVEHGQLDSGSDS